MPAYPETIGKYQIEALVAKGGMGAVFKALHPTLKRRVIIKKLTTRGNSTITERFKREARILMDFRNNHIVRVFDHFKEGSSHYIVLEYVDGMSLDQLIRQQRSLSCELALVIFLDACLALQYAHGMGVIHRDIKPGNILISKKGEVKLADFGIAASEEEDDPGLTREGMTLGTPSYMPPEQIENSKNVDRRADIYAMGVMLYEMVTGKKPYPGNFAPDTVVLIQKGRHRPARKVNPRVPPYVDRLIRKLMRPDMRKRFQTMDAVIRAVNRYLARYPAAAIRGVLTDLLAGKCQEEPRFRPIPRKRFLLGAILLLLAGIAAGSWYAWTEGLAYRHLMPNRWGGLQVVVRVPKSEAEAEDLLLRARLFRNDGKDIPEVEGVRVIFSPTATAQADPFHTFVSSRVFLPPGPYRVKLSVDQDLLWESFHLRPYSMAPPGEDGTTTLQFRMDENRPRPLSVRAEARDAHTGEPLTGAAFAVHIRGSWLPIGELAQGDLSTGAVWRFRADAQGYLPETFVLRIAHAQERLSLVARLVPKPDVLELKTPADRTSPLSGPGRAARIKISDEGGTLRSRVEE